MKVKNSSGREGFVHSFILPFILSNVQIESDPSSVNQAFHGFFFISVIALFCFLNIIFYIFTYVVLSKDKYKEKCPKWLHKLIAFYKDISLIYITLEVVLCLICLLLLVGFSFLFIVR